MHRLKWPSPASDATITRVGGACARRAGAGPWQCGGVGAPPPLGRTVDLRRHSAGPAEASLPALTSAGRLKYTCQTPVQPMAPADDATFPVPTAGAHPGRRAERCAPTRPRTARAPRQNRKHGAGAGAGEARASPSAGLTSARLERRVRRKWREQCARACRDGGQGAGKQEGNLAWYEDGRRNGDGEVGLEEGGTVAVWRGGRGGGAVGSEF